ncbi:hypothetical protein ACLKA7_003763 [Drosophila subpalustris]
MANFINNPSQQRYYFKKNIAYTEDHIVVKKLFLYNVAAELMASQLQTYFESYGSVLHLQLFGCKAHAGGKKQLTREGNRKSRTGYVFFANPRDAAKALRHTRHIVGGHRLSVQANDSWHQPDAYGSEDKSVSEEPPAVIMNLNDHCLEHILRHLSLPDRIHFARTCTRFRSVYLQASAALHRSICFDVFDGMTLWDMRDFFQLSGQHLQHIEGIVPPARCQRLCEYFGVHCINLRSVRVTASKLSVRNMHKMFAKLHLLQDLQLRACALSNTGLLALKHLKKLKRLDLSDNRQLSGLNMNCLPASIEALTLTNCNGFQSKYLSKICRALPKLRELHMKAVYTITTGFQQVITGKCGLALEELTISSNPTNEYEHIAKLPRLRKIVLYSVEQGDALRSKLLPWLVEHKAEQLQHFESRGQNSINTDMLPHINGLSALRTLMLPHNNIIGEPQLEVLRLQHLELISLKYWLHLTNAAVLRLLLNCPKLHVLHLEECPRLTDKLLHDIIFKLRLQVRLKEVQRRLPIQMHVYGSKINEFSLQHADVAAKDLIHATLIPPSSSDLCLVRMSHFLEFDFNSDDYDIFVSDDEVDPDYDRYMYDVGFLSDDDNEYDEMVFQDDDLLMINMENVEEILHQWNQQNFPFF